MKLEIILVLYGNEQDLWAFAGALSEIASTTYGITVDKVESKARVTEEEKPS